MYIQLYVVDKLVSTGGATPSCTEVDVWTKRTPHAGRADGRTPGGRRGPDVRRAADGDRDGAERTVERTQARALREKDPREAASVPHTNAVERRL